MRTIFLVFIGSVLTGVLTDVWFGVVVFCAMTYTILPAIEGK